MRGGCDAYFLSYINGRGQVNQPVGGQVMLECKTYIENRDDIVDCNKRLTDCTMKSGLEKCKYTRWRMMDPTCLCNFY